VLLDFICRKDTGYDFASTTARIDDQKMETIAAMNIQKDASSKRPVTLDSALMCHAVLRLE